MAKLRSSKVKNQILRCLYAALKKDFIEVKSTDLNQMVNYALTIDAQKSDPKADEVRVHPNNFRVSCAMMVEHGFIKRWKDGLDWYVCITPEGIEYLEKIHNGDSKPNS